MVVPLVVRGAAEVVDRGVLVTGATLILVWWSAGSQVLHLVTHLGAPESLLVRSKPGTLLESPRVLEVQLLEEVQVQFSSLVAHQVIQVS